LHQENQQCLASGKMARIKLELRTSLGGEEKESPIVVNVGSCPENVQIG